MQIGYSIIARLILVVEFLIPLMLSGPMAYGAEHPVAKPYQFDSPTTQCAHGMWAFASGKIMDGRSLLEAGYRARQEQRRQNPQPTNHSDSAFEPCSIFLGYLYLDVGDIARTRQIYEAELAYVGDEGHPQVRWALLAGIGVTYLFQGMNEQAKAQFTKALPLVEDPAFTTEWTSPRMREMALAVTIHGIGLAQFAVTSPRTQVNAKNYVQVRHHFEETLTILRRLNRASSGNTRTTDLILDSIAPTLGLGESELGTLRFFIQSAGIEQSFSAGDLAALQLILPIIQMLPGTEDVTIETIAESLIIGLLDEMLIYAARGFEPIVLNNIAETYRRQAVDLESDAVKYKSARATGLAATNTDETAETRAWASWSNNGTDIVYAEWSNENWNLWRVNVETLEHQQLTSSGMHKVPVWSPSGDKIAFTAALRDTNDYGDIDNDDERHLYVINGDGSNLRQLTNESEYYDSSPSWTNDDMNLIFSRRVKGKTVDDNGPGELAMINIDTGKIRMLTFTSANESAPHISPTGDQIVFTVKSDDEDDPDKIFVADWDGVQIGEPEFIANGYNPTWRPKAD